MRKKSEKKNPTPAISPDDTQGFKSYLKNKLVLVEKVVTAHNLYTQDNGGYPAHFDKKQMEKIFKDLLIFDQNIDTYITKYQPASEWEDLKTKLMIYLIEINNVLQTQHGYLAIAKISSDYRAKTHLEKALYHLEEAIKYRNKYTWHKDPQYMLHLDMKKEEILESLKRYRPFEATNDIDKHLVSARNDQDLEKAYEAFKKASELAGAEAGTTKDYSKQFNILLEQADFYFVKSKLSNVVMNRLSEEQIDRHFNCIVKSSSPLILASMLIVFNKPVRNSYTGIQCQAVCHKLYAATKNFLILSGQVQNLDKRINFLKQAHKTLTWSNQLVEKIKFQDDEFMSKRLNLENQIKENLIYSEIAKEKNIKDEADKIIQEAEMAKCIAEYEEQFELLLKLFETPKKEKLTVVQKKEKDESSSSEDSSSSSEVEIEKPQASVPSLKKFDLDFNIKLLEDAKKEKNIAQQIYISASIGEFLQWKAARHLKKKEYNNAIENLKLAIIYFTEPHQLISDTQSNTEIDSSQKKIWLGNLLQTTNETLSRTLSILKNIEQRFEYTRTQAKQYIISKYGRNAWFKQDQIERPISKNAQILKDAKEKIILVEKMQKEFQQTFQIQPTEPSKIAAALIANSTVCRPAIPVPQKQKTNKINSASFR